jgi:hypothetical protein
MVRRRTPQEKKALVYEKDHHIDTEYPHAFRIGWPRKKAGAHRAYRRTVRQLLQDVDAESALSDDASGDVRAEAVRRRPVRKWGQGIHGSALPLRAWIERQRERRIVSTAHSFFKRPYDQTLHGERFAAFLASVIEGKTPYARQLAIFLSNLLPDPLPHAWPTPHNGRRDMNRAWLAAFLVDYPDWEQRVRRWIAQRLAAS